MATLLEFRARSVRGEGRRNPSAACEIVIFPGVRYERWTDACDEKPRTRRVRPRDRLELED